MGMHYRAALQAKFAPPGGGRDMEEGLDGGRDRTAGFLTLIKKGFLFLKRRVSYFSIKSSMYEYINFSRNTSNASGSLISVTWRGILLMVAQSLFLNIESQFSRT